MRHTIPLLASLAAALAVVTLSTGAQAADRYCLQGRIWGYPGNCQFDSYRQCMATASGTDAYCGLNPRYAFAPRRKYR